MVKGKILFWVIVIILLLSTPLVLGEVGRGPESKSILTGRAGIRSDTTYVPLMIILGIITLIVFHHYKNNKKLKIFVPVILLCWVVLIILISKTDVYESVPLVEDWQNDISSLVTSDDKVYLEDNYYLDYNNPMIILISEGLISSSISAEEYTKKALDYVYDNVKYDVYENDDVCLADTAITVLERGTGQCDTQSMVVVSLLRRAGIPSRIIGGCISHIPDCSGLMGFLSISRRPLYTELIVDEIIGDVYSRHSIGRSGGLHAYPQAKLPISGLLVWHTLEATTGEFADLKCYSYYPEIEDPNKKQICVSEDYDYAVACATDNQEKLGEYGGRYTI